MFELKMRTLLVPAACALAIVSAPTFLSSTSVQASSAQTASVPPPSTYRAMLDRYCVVCHNEKLRTANLMLDRMDLSRIGDGAPVWEKVVQKLRTGSMPPIGRPRPDKVLSDAFLSSLEEHLDRAAAAKPNVGRPLLHRLNRTEYANAIRDLLALEIDVAALLPPDDSADGFDNVANALGVSPLLINQYLSAARKISRVAIGDPKIVPAMQIYRNAADLTQHDRLDGLPLGTRGGISVRHTFPLDGEYEFRLTLVRNIINTIRGLQQPHQIDVMLDDVVLQTFTVGGPDSYKAEGSGGILAATPALRADEPLHFRTRVPAGTHTLTAAFVMKTHAQAEDLRQPSLRSFNEGASVIAGIVHIESIAVSGPFGPVHVGDTETRRRIFVCRPKNLGEEPSCAKKIIATLARRAFRGPVSDSTLRELQNFYAVGRREGRTFEAGIQMALRRILVSPQFVFRFERDLENIPPGTVYPINDFDLASRLSFFLWSSIPDDELLSEAEKGRLRDPVTLEHQARRMLADPRAQSLVSNFAGQWLQLRNLANWVPYQGAFPDFDDNLRQALRRETELFVESVIREDRTVLDFLDAKDTFVNERLARHYGIPHVYGSHFRRVILDGDRRRGLFGQASILTLTSYGNRTAPTIRGKWVLENILGTPPPPPPPNVPSLKEEEGSGNTVLTMRQRMEEHRKNPVCASCHAGMDPLGFALENFDAVGAWRDTIDAKTHIDASGILPDGAKFEGPAGLRQALLPYREAFVKTLTTKLVTYALGRGVEYYDMPAIRQIVRDSARDDYRWSALVLGIIKSAPFQMRMSTERVSTSTATSAALRP